MGCQEIHVGLRNCKSTVLLLTMLGEGFALLIRREATGLLANQV